MSSIDSFGALTVKPQPFEAGILKMAVWRVLPAGAPSPEDAAALVAGARRHQVGLAVCRLAEGDPWQVSLCATGFRLVETLITYEGEIPGAAAMPDGVRTATPADIPACRDIAKAAFRNDRFHAEPAIDDADADAIKAQWIENAISGRADTVLVAEVDGAVAGFNACLQDGEAAVIDLIGVAPSAQGRGVGAALLAAASAVYAGRARVLRAGTQADNTASCRLYDAAGMAPVARQTTLHWTP